MVRAYGRLVIVVVLGVIGALSIARAALAAPASPEAVAKAAIAQMMDLYDALDARANETIEETIGETAGRGTEELTLAKRFKALAGAVGAIEKDCSKTQSQIQKIASKALTQLDRLGADPGLVNEVNNNYGLAGGAINALKFDAAATMFNALGDYLGYIS